MPTPISTSRRTIFGSRRTRGATLLELMAVIVLYAILNSPQIQNFLLERNSAKASVSIGNLSQIAQKIQEYCDNNNGTCPPAGSITATTFGGANNQYMVNPPLDPITHTAYTLNITTNADGTQSFTIDAPGIYDSTALSNTPTATGTYPSNSTATSLHYSQADGGVYKS